MSWNEYENSVANGQPVSLYEFSRENRIFWRYTNADKAITLDNKVFIATAMSDSGSASGGEDSMTIKAPANNPVAMLYRGMPPSGNITVRVYTLHYSDVQQEFRVKWVGFVSEVRRPETNEAEIISTSLAATFSRTGLRLTWGRACPYSVYDSGCRLKKNEFVISGLTISKMDGATITLNLPAGIPAGWLNAGFIEWDVGTVTERRHITVHQYNALTMLGGTHGLSIGTEILAYPGCTRDVQTCHSKFNNVLNFGGIPDMPGKSPFDGSRIF